MRAGPGRGRRWALAGLAALLGTGGVGQVGAAEVEPGAHGPAGVTVARRVIGSGPRGPEPVALAVGTGYGYTETVLGLSDRHHRLVGSLLGEAALRPWLGLGLRLDGRYDRHAFGDGRPSDDGWVGEPRLYARADRSLGQLGSVGGRLSVFFPGGNAPSIETDAVSGELTGMYSYAFGQTTVTGNAGYRLDRSGQAAVNADRLSPSDRLSLGLSNLDAATLGAAGHHRRGPWAVFAEASWDILLGEGAPGAGAWPLRLGAGASRQISERAHVEMMLEANTSSRPAQGMTMPLVPMPPRVAVLAELVFALGGSSKPAIKTDPGPPEPQPELLVPMLQVQIEGVSELPPDAQVVLQQGGQERTFTRGTDGRFALTDIHPGPATVVASAPGYRPHSKVVRLEPGKQLLLGVALVRDLPSGQIRGAVRAFDGRPLTANIRLQSRDPNPAAGWRATLPGGGAPVEERRSADGSFQFDVPPGRYRVTIGAPGHDPQTRLVEVEDNGVTVLNVDLRRAR